MSYDTFKTGQKLMKQILLCVTDDKFYLEILEKLIAL